MSFRILLQVLFASALVTASADAASVNLTIRLGDSVPAGLGLTTGMTLSGLVTYNASLVPTTGGTTLTPVNDSSLTINLTLAGELFNQDDDVDPDFPQLYFTDGVLTGINYYADNHHPASAGAGYVQIETNMTGTSFNYSFDGLSDYTGEVSWISPSSPVPEPSAALLVGLASLISFRRSIRR
jgi:hypothetical protein